MTSEGTKMKRIKMLSVLAVSVLATLSFTVVALAAAEEGGDHVDDFVLGGENCPGCSDNHLGLSDLYHELDDLGGPFPLGLSAYDTEDVDGSVPIG
ncbi:MAG: hypothetical protein LBV13_01085 [Methanomassiliicoccaceae archaeon]|jgi:hypothetical protein|nr:hypothetical protein [Methanomassiliicoccaceae archaeon]